MSKEKKAPAKKAKGNTATVKTVSGQLTAALSSLKAGMGEKKFKKRIKKAAKIMIAGIKATPVKKAAHSALRAVKAKKAVPAKKKAVKKTAKKKK